MAAARNEAFNQRTVIVMIVAGIAAFIAFILLLTYAGDMSRSKDGRAHAQSVAATGFAGLMRLSEATGRAPRVARDDGEIQTEDLLVVTVEPQMKREALTKLAAERPDQPTLVILPKWETMPDPVRKGWVRSTGQVDLKTVNDLIGDLGKVVLSRPERKGRATAFGVDWFEGTDAARPDQVQAIDGQDVTPLLQTRDGDVLLGQIGERPLYILADPDLMNNFGLAKRETAASAVEILDMLNSTEAEGIAFDLTLNGLGSKPNALKLLFEPPFVVVTLVLFIATILGGLQGAFRFGPAAKERREIALGKTMLVENSAGLLSMTRRQHRAAPAYGDLLREAAARETGAPGHLSGTDLDAYLDRIGSGRGDRFTTLSGRLAQSRDARELLDRARALFTWKKGLAR